MWHTVTDIAFDPRFCSIINHYDNGQASCGTRCTMRLWHTGQMCSFRSKVLFSRRALLLRKSLYPISLIPFAPSHSLLPPPLPPLSIFLPPPSFPLFSCCNLIACVSSSPSRITAPSLPPLVLLHHCFALCPWREGGGEGAEGGRGQAGRRRG